MAKTTRAALYLRVSTDGQTTENQRIALERVVVGRLSVPTPTMASVVPKLVISGLASTRR
jgi:hypothetical protein